MSITLNMFSYYNEPSTLCFTVLTITIIEFFFFSFFLFRFTQRNLLRIYPKGTRILSTNYDPHVGWGHGAQMVAFNMQVRLLISVQRGFCF